MIVKIHSRGADSGSGPVDYLLGKARDRDKAVVLRGEPERVRQLIDGCEFARAYTSGVLYRDWETDRKSTRLNSSHLKLSRMPSSA